MGARWLVPLVALALLAAAACESDSGDSEDFARFADKIARAAEARDVGFFADRIEGYVYTCTEEEVEISTGPDAPEEPICLEVGLQFEAIPISNYGTSGVVSTPEVLINDIEGFFEDALPEEEDEYGSGAVRLFATAIPSRPGQVEGESNLRTAILTAVQLFQLRPVRIARGIDFEFVDDRWVIRSETTAGFPIAIELLSATSAVTLYDEWTAY